MLIRQQHSSPFYMDIEERLQLVAQEPTEEIVTKDELRDLFLNSSSPKHYIGLEVSGLLHLGSLVLTGFKINDFIRAGVNCTVFLADWHTYINDKLERDWDKIRQISDYYSEAFRFFCPGVNIVLGSNLYREKGYEYWNDLILFSKHLTLARTVRSITIMGRSEQDRLDFSQLLYPAMQSIDIKALESEIAHAGMDQRKIHMLSRDIFPKLGWRKPIAVHHHLLPRLTEPNSLEFSRISSPGEKVASKMSKSKPESGILIHDDPDLIKRKIEMAYCPVGAVKYNPLLELTRYVIFHEFSEFVVERASRYGGTMSYNNYARLESDFQNRVIHPADLKQAVSLYLDRIIGPIRRHFKGREPNLRN
jgi:tyrosyl-tRNA synthetase